MIQSSKGITIVALILTIAVLMILASVTIYAGDNIIKQAKLQNINTNMMLIQAKVKTISEQAKFNKDTSNYKGNMISSVIGNKKIDNLVSNGIIEDVTKYYLLSQNDLNSMGLEKINIEDGYIINYETEEIIYVKGFQNHGEVYYKLSETKTLTIK